MFGEEAAELNSVGGVLASTNGLWAVVDRGLAVQRYYLCWWRMYGVWTELCWTSEELYFCGMQAWPRSSFRVQDVIVPQSVLR